MLFIQALGLLAGVFLLPKAYFGMGVLWVLRRTPPGVLVLIWIVGSIVWMFS